MSKFNIESIVKKVLEESLQEKTDYLVNKIKSKISEEPETAPNPDGCKKIKEIIADGGEDTLGKLEEYCGKSEMGEGLYGNQKRLDKNKNNKIDSEDFKMLRKEDDDELEEGNAFTGALSKAKKSGKDSFEVDGKKYSVKESNKKFFKKSVKESFRLTENELIDLIERIVIEDKKAKGMAETEKVLSTNKKENEEAIKAVTKKMKEYLKMGHEGEYETNPEQFPLGNGQIKKMQTMKYNPSEAVDEYIEAFAYPGMTNLVYDEIKPDDKKIDKYLKGDSTTGNAVKDKKGKALGNVVPSKVGDRFKKNYDENLYGQEQMNASYKRQPQPVDQAGETTQRGSLKSKKGKKTAQSVLNAVEESTTKQQTKLNETFDKMKHLIDYNKKTQ
jgi:hypothetical protein